MATYRLFPSASGPGTATSYTLGSPFISGMTFFVTGEAWFQGYWWWVCPNGGQNTGATKCALWQMDPSGVPHLVPGSVVSTPASGPGSLVAGQWNFIPLGTPLLLSLGGSAGASPKSAVTGVPGPAQYTAAVGCNGPFPDTPGYWGSGQVAPNGITNGPLTAYSALSAGLPAPLGGMPQGSFSVAGSDPSASCPQSASGTDNFWVDVQVGDYATAAPAGASLRLWPNFPVPVLTTNNDNTTAMSATAFTLSQPCKLDRIWLFSPANAQGLPIRVAIWYTGTRAEVSGTDNASPAWSGAAGSGWVSVDYTSSGVTLPAANLTVSFWNGGQKIYADNPNYWFSGTDPVGGAAVGGAGWNGVSRGGGILVAPNVANGPLLVYDDSSGTKPGQSAYQPGPTAWTYPGEFEASADWGETRWVDVEVTPVTTPSGSALLLAGFP